MKQRLRLSAWFCTVAVAVLAGCHSSASNGRVTKGVGTPVEMTQPTTLDEAMAMIDHRPDWTDFPPLDIPRHPAEKYLKGLTIVLDPGHGGEDGGDKSTQPADYKAGPAGTKEAFMNLRVGLLLQRLLADAGVKVIMTRQGDDTLSLKERAEVANNASRPDGGTGADLFISLHHNAVNNPETNYSTTWYHGSVDNNEVELDVAEPIAHALGRALRTQVAKTSPVLSSQLMYPGGFGVLRQCKVPAILLESSFYTDPAEEQRLRDAAYNLREAYAIYVGLCEWAYGGRPTQSAPVVTLDGSTVRLRTTLSDGLPAWWGADRNRILTSSVSWTVDGQRADGHYDPITHELEATWFHDPAGGLRRDDRQQYVVTLHHANMFGHHNWPQRYRVTIAPDGEAGGITVEPLGPVRDVYRAPTTRPATAPAMR